MPHPRREKKQKVMQMGNNYTDTAKEKRMYAIQNAEKYYPVKILSDFISQTEKTHKVCSTIVQSQLGLPKYMNLSGTQIHLSNIISLHDISSNENAPRVLHTKLTA